ncbi:hypothetical protein BaRGS_00031055 [Batillaria attramentaria]|uniref:Uncharacterized protein n=1 Tax=Batillaria attramentaria TaxID=370345 RepID=A0ABD0JS05_9CAEN
MLGLTWGSYSPKDGHGVVSLPGHIGSYHASGRQLYTTVHVPMRLSRNKNGSMGLLWKGRSSHQGRPLSVMSCLKGETQTHSLLTDRKVTSTFKPWINSKKKDPKCPGFKFFPADCRLCPSLRPQARGYQVNLTNTLMDSMHGQRQMTFDNTPQLPSTTSSTKKEVISMCRQQRRVQRGHYCDPHAHTKLSTNKVYTCFT